MLSLTADQITLLATLCEPLCRDEEERLRLIEHLNVSRLPGSEIDIHSPSKMFAHQLIVRMLDSASGKSTLKTFLALLRSQANASNQAQLDALETTLFDALAFPSADYNVVTQGGPFIFISYATANAAFADRLRVDLSAAGLNLWIDHVGLKVGTPNWEDAIRDALKRADSVLLVASPTSRKSNYVRDELAIAKDNGKPVYPVWAEGEVWSESIPMGLGYTQYVDLRAEKYDEGVKALIDALDGTPQISAALVGAAKADDKSQSSNILLLDPHFVPRNPYKGLSAFRSDDQQDFYGRELFVTELVDQLRINPCFLAIIGASGSGKSSVVMAGLLPQLIEGKKLSGSEKWIYLDPFVPGKRPLEALSLSLAKQMPQKSQSAIDEDLINPSTRGLHRLSKQITTTRVVLYIDQFEELFTQTDNEQERRQFIDLLTTAASEPDNVVTIILSMRADFYDRPLAYTDLAQLIEANNRAVLPLMLADLYDVILKPAAQEDVRLQFDSGLAEDMVFSVKGEAGVLPLLQFTLDQLFQHRDGLHLTWAAYDALGGVRGALAKHAETTYQGLNPEEQKLARGLFLRLIEPGATEQDTTRRRARRRELTLLETIQTEHLRIVADKFVKARLLTTDSVLGEETIEVSHEALIREWERLKAWLNEARDDVTLMKRIAADADEWTRKQMPEDSLYRGKNLREAETWAENNAASAVELNFILMARKAEEKQIAAEDKRKEELRSAATRAEQAALDARLSSDHAERQRRRAGQAIRIALLLIVFAAGIGVFAWMQTRAAEEAQTQVSTQIAALNRIVPGATEGARWSLWAAQQNQESRLSLATAGAPTGIINADWTPVIQTFDGVKMVLVPSGCFMMGSLSGNADEQPVNRQCFREDFWLDYTEVTQGQFIAFDGEMTQEFVFSGENRPVENINWFEARDFCQQRRNARLPNEREWEYAARGPDGWTYPWGNVFVSENAIFNRTEEHGTANILDSDGNPIRPNGASWVGALDLSGNVYEWTSTRYDDPETVSAAFEGLREFFPYPYRDEGGREEDESIEAFNHRVEETKLYTQRVVRGGAWNNPATYLRGSIRFRIYANYGLNFSGFRCARSVSDGE